MKMKEICEQYGAIFIDNSQHPFFLDHSDLFNDAMHLNDKGAQIYTRIVLTQITNQL